MDKPFSPQSGFIFLEILIATAAIGVVLSLMLGIASLVVTHSYSLKQEAKADYLMREEVEALRSFRDATAWASGVGAAAIGSTSPYYFTVSGSQWIPVYGTETTGIFTRNVVFDRVSRDPSTGAIESLYNGLHDDPETRKATVTVTGNGKTYQVVLYLTNWQNK